MPRLCLPISTCPFLLIANRQNSVLPISSDTPDSKSLKDQQLRS